MDATFTFQLTRVKFELVGVYHTSRGRTSETPLVWQRLARFSWGPTP